MDPSIVPFATEPLAETPAVKLQREGIQIQNLTIERRGIVDYLKNMTADKVEVALVHALEVGVVAIEARRAEFRRRTEKRA